MRERVRREQDYWTAPLREHPITSALVVVVSGAAMLPPDRVR